MTDRELDALVAEKLGIPQEWVRDPVRGGTWQVKDWPRLSTTGDGMLAVIERMKEIPAVDVRGGQHFQPDPDGWRLQGAYENKAYPSGERNFHVTFGAADPETQAIVSADAPTLPRAVCLAALRAVGAKPGEGR